MAEYSRYLDEQVECMPRPALEALQAERLRSSLPHAFAQAGLLRQVWGAKGVHPRDIRSMADFQALAPFIDKDDIRVYRDRHDDPAGGLSNVKPPLLKGIGFTSGTTGDPTPVPRAARTPYDTATQRDIWELGARPGDYACRVMFTFRYGQSLNRFLHLGVKPIPFELSARELPRLFKASLQYRPTTLSLVSNGLILAMEETLDRLKLDPLDVFASYRGVLFGGEPLGGRQRALARDWGLDMFETTSLGDVIGTSDCRAHQGFHAWEDYALVECLDPETGQPVADGEIGEMVVTSLVPDVTSLVRFRTDDLIVLDRSRCACGRTHARIRLLGRRGDQMLVAGKSVMPRDVWPLVEAETACRAGLFQLIRPARQVDILRLRVGYEAKACPFAEALRQRLSHSIEAVLQVPVMVELVDNADLLRQGPPHKIPRVTKQ